MAPGTTGTTKYSKHTCTSTLGAFEVIKLYSSTAAGLESVSAGLRCSGSGALEGDTAKVQAARLLGVADALVRQQGYMLAQIVAEIHAPDLAAGDAGGAGEAASGDDDVGLSGYALALDDHLRPQYFSALAILSAMNA